MTKKDDSESEARFSCPLCELVSSLGKQLWAVCAGGAKTPNDGLTRGGEETKQTPSQQEED